MINTPCEDEMRKYCFQYLDNWEKYEEYSSLYPPQFNKLIHDCINIERSYIDNRIDLAARVLGLEFLKEYIGKVEGSIEASYKEIKNNERFCEKFVQTLWPFKYIRKKDMKKFSEYEKTWLGVFKRIRNLEKKDQKKALEITKSAVREMVDDPYLTSGYLIRYLLERMRIAKGVEEPLFAYSGEENFSGVYEFDGRIVSNPEEETIFHEMGHEEIRKAFIKYNEEKLNKRKFTKALVKSFQKVLKKVQENKNLRDIASLVYDIFLKFYHRGCYFLIELEHEIDEAFADAFAATITGMNCKSSTFKNWEKHYGKFDRKKYYEWYDIFYEYFKDGITEEKLNKIPELIKKNKDSRGYFSNVSEYLTHALKKFSRS